MNLQAKGGNDTNAVSVFQKALDQYHSNLLTTYAAVKNVGHLLWIFFNSFQHNFSRIFLEFFPNFSLSSLSQPNTMWNPLYHSVMARFSFNMRKCHQLLHVPWRKKSKRQKRSYPRIWELIFLGALSMNLLSISTYSVKIRNNFYCDNLLLFYFISMNVLFIFETLSGILRGTK